MEALLLLLMLVFALEFGVSLLKVTAAAWAAKEEAEAFVGAWGEEVFLEDLENLEGLEEIPMLPNIAKKKWYNERITKQWAIVMKGVVARWIGSYTALAFSAMMFGDVLWPLRRGCDYEGVSCACIPDCSSASCGQRTQTQQQQQQLKDATTLYHHTIHNRCSLLLEEKQYAVGICAWTHTAVATIRHPVTIAYGLARLILRAIDNVETCCIGFDNIQANVEYTHSSKLQLWIQTARTCRGRFWICDSIDIFNK